MLQVLACRYAAMCFIFAVKPCCSVTIALQFKLQTITWHLSPHTNSAFVYLLPAQLAVCLPQILQEPSFTTLCFLVVMLTGVHAASTAAACTQPSGSLVLMPAAKLQPQAKRVFAIAVQSFCTTLCLCPAPTAAACTAQEQQQLAACSWGSGSHPSEQPHHRQTHCKN
ncbi:hypothetical protein COO60DRAFT_979843 [Scenedesmus sp. NREL 46B-D3]|nr:hypothetical protein COO60DRAFT_979843 [Scenedesmus sp. NREL 46B-D3]